MTDAKQTTGRTGKGDGSPPSLLELIARSRSKEFLDRKKRVEESPYHPTEELLREYVLDQLDESDAEIIMDHLSLCGPCAREALRMTWKLQGQTESLWTKVSELVANLATRVSIHVYAEEQVRGEDQESQERRYCPGDDLAFLVEAPDDGYVTVLHGCDETGAIELVFPIFPDDDPKVTAGQQLGPLDGSVDGPQGEHSLIVFWTRNRVLDLTEVDPGNEEEVETAIVRFLDAIDALPEEDWAMGLIEYEVLEKDKPGNP